MIVDDAEIKALIKEVENILEENDQPPRIVMKSGKTLKWHSLAKRSINCAKKYHAVGGDTPPQLTLVIENLWLAAESQWGPSGVMTSVLLIDSSEDANEILAKIIPARLIADKTTRMRMLSALNV